MKRIDSVLLSIPSASSQIGHLSPEGRLLVVCCGLVLFGWALLKLRHRSMLVPTCSLFLTVGLLFILFSAFPDAFDHLSYFLGVKYPPVLYLIGCLFILTI